VGAEISEYFMKSYFISLVLIIPALLVACKPASPPPTLSFEHGWVRAMPPGVRMTAAYGVITNNGSDPITISSFTSDSFAMASLHRTGINNGISTMEQLPGLTQSAGDSSVLEPGGLHLMLMNPTREIRPGDSVGLTLTTSSGRKYHFSLPVEAR